MDAALKKADIKLTAADLKQILNAVSWRVETAPPVIAKVHKPGKAKADPLRGLFEATVDGKPAIVEYEPDSDLRDTEQVPLLEDGGIEAFIRREVLPYTPDAWIKEDATKIGYEVSFTRHFYKPQPLRTLEEISADILAIEKEAEGLLDGLAEGRQRASMIADLKPYPEYKESGLPWLGQVPAHWEVAAASRRCFAARNERRPLTRTAVCYQSLAIQGVIRTLAHDAHESRQVMPSRPDPATRSLRRAIWSSTSMQAWQGSMGVSEYRGIVSPAYLRLSTSRMIESAASFTHSS